MSIDIYKKKWCLKTSDERICNIVLYYNSRTYESNSRKHPRFMALYNPIKSILVKQDEYDKAWNKAIEQEMSFTKELDGTVSDKSPTYYGNKYPSGDTYAAKKAFASSKRAIDASEFFNNGNVIIFKFFKSPSLSYVESVSCTNEGFLMDAQAEYEKLVKENEGGSISIGIDAFGPDVDPFKR